MRKYFILLFAFSCFFANAIDRTAIANIDNGPIKGWQNPNNWSPVGVPENSDVVIIPAGQIISVKGNVYSTAVKLTLYIYGTLDFNPSGTLNLTSASLVQLFTAASRITTNGSSSEQIIIGGDIKYSGNNDGIITGPAFANMASATSKPGTPGASFSSGVLPVKLSTFIATEKKNGVKISWTTLLESGVKSFEVQKSSDGTDWKTIAQLMPKNTCQCGTTYQYEDIADVTRIQYYRLTTNDIDGKKSYSTTVSVRSMASNKDVVWSINASGTELMIQINTQKFSMPAQIQLYNAQGQLLQKKMIDGTTIMNTYNLGTGIAFFIVEDGKGNSFRTKIRK